MNYFGRISVNEKNLAELQLLKRGNIFKNCFFTVLLLLFVNLSLLKLDIKILNSESAMLLFMQIPITLFCIEMILYDIYPVGENRMRLLYVGYGGRYCFCNFSGQ